LRTGQTLHSEARIASVCDGDAGRSVVVQGVVVADGFAAVEIVTSFLFRGHAPDFGSNFTHTCEQPVFLTLDSRNILALLRSKEWFVPRSGNGIHVGQTLRFSLESHHRFCSASALAHTVSFGAIHAQQSNGEWTHVADVDYESSAVRQNAVVAFLKSHAHTVEATMRSLDSAQAPAADMPTGVVVAAASHEYAQASGDHNPIHT
ncbi:hypothetical protein EV177_010009, partial [Coemansia sp. RSA 1804]